MTEDTTGVNMQLQQLALITEAETQPGFLMTPQKPIANSDRSEAWRNMCRTV